MKSIKVMEKKDKKQRDIVLSQDNALTTARYKFDKVELVACGSQRIVLRQDYIPLFLVFLLHDFNAFRKGNIYLRQKQMFDVEYLS